MSTVSWHKEMQYLPSTENLRLIDHTAVNLHMIIMEDQVEAAEEEVVVMVMEEEAHTPVVLQVTHRDI